MTTDMKTEGRDLFILMISYRDDRSGYDRGYDERYLYLENSLFCSLLVFWNESKMKGL
jgi:hypothetical protein